MADGEDLPRQEVGEVIRVPDERHGDEDRCFEVVMASATPTVGDFVAESSARIDNLHAHVSDVD